MTEIQEEYLNLAVIEQKKFDDISKILKIERELVPLWWDELKIEREYLSVLRKIWKAKFDHTDKFESFWEFKNWHEQTDKRCHYCGVTQYQIEKLWQKRLLYTKRNRGRKLEIERLKPNEPYDNIKNLVFSCYWCNNAKTDEFTEGKFKVIAAGIKEAWVNRLNNIR